MILNLLENLFFPIYLRAATIDLNFDSLSAAPADPASAVLKFYNFGLGIAGLLAFGVIVFAALKYTFAAGNPSAQSDAKDRITNALLGLLLLLGAAFLLGIIDPNLKTLTNPDIAQLSAPPVKPIVGTPVATFEEGNCPVAPQTYGRVTPDWLRTGCFGENASSASAIAMAESGGDQFRMSTIDRCAVDNKSVSGGYFQINITANKVPDPNAPDKKNPNQWLNCPAAFAFQNAEGNIVNAVDSGGQQKPGFYYGSPKLPNRGHDCKVIDMDLYDRCVSAVKNADSNIEVACKLSKNGQSFDGIWGANVDQNINGRMHIGCHFP